VRVRGRLGSGKLRGERGGGGKEAFLAFSAAHPIARPCSHCCSCLRFSLASTRSSPSGHTQTTAASATSARRSVPARLSAAPSPLPFFLSLLSAFLHLLPSFVRRLSLPLCIAFVLSDPPLRVQLRQTRPGLLRVSAAARRTCRKHIALSHSGTRPRASARECSRGGKELECLRLFPLFFISSPLILVRSPTTGIPSIFSFRYPASFHGPSCFSQVSPLDCLGCGHCAAVCSNGCLPMCRLHGPVAAAIDSLPAQQPAEAATTTTAQATAVNAESLSPSAAPAVCITPTAKAMATPSTSADSRVIVGDKRDSNIPRDDDDTEGRRVVAEQCANWAFASTLLPPHGPPELCCLLQRHCGAQHGEGNEGGSPLAPRVRTHATAGDSVSGETIPSDDEVIEDMHYIPHTVCRAARHQ